MLLPCASVNGYHGNSRLFKSFCKLDGHHAFTVPAYSDFGRNGNIGRLDHRPCNPLGKGKILQKTAPSAVISDLRGGTAHIYIYKIRPIFHGLSRRSSHNNGVVSEKLTCHGAFPFAHKEQLGRLFIVHGNALGRGELTDAEGGAAIRADFSHGAVGNSRHGRKRRIALYFQVSYLQKIIPEIY